MIKFQYIIFSSTETFKFRLKESVSFNFDKNLGQWQLLDPQSEEVVAICNNNIIEIKAGYMWDGSTVIGEYYEDHETLEASLLHDVLYNAKKNPDNIEVSFTLFEAGRIFRDLLLKLYENNESYFKRKLFPRLYYLGLITIGIPWKFGNNEYYKLKKAD
jgi:hypothetical protein